jgi:hypothetical protein
MSASRNTNTTNKNAKPFCKVCQDAGKSEKEYTSHYVRQSPDPNSPVVCPTLLSQSCRYCDKPGHTTKHCPNLASDQKKEKKEAYLKAKKEEEYKKATQKPVTKPTKSTNLFSALDSDSEEEEKPKPKAKKQVTTSKPVPVPAKAPASEQATPQFKIVANEFPELPTLAKTETSSKHQKQSSQYQLKTILQSQFPDMRLPEKMQEVYVLKPPMAKLVRKQEQEQELLEQDDWEQATPATHYNFAADAEFFKNRPKGSTMNWAEEEEESSDEEEYNDGNESDESW